MNDDVMSEWKLSGNAAFIPQKKVGCRVQVKIVEFSSLSCVSCSAPSQTFLIMCKILTDNGEVKNAAEGDPIHFSFSATVCLPILLCTPKK